MYQKPCCIIALRWQEDLAAQLKALGEKSAACRTAAALGHWCFCFTSGEQALRHAS
jgi:hypothetical protein